MLLQTGSRLRNTMWVVFPFFLSLVLSACNPTGDATPALQGAIVPTRIATETPTQTATATTTPTMTFTPTMTLTSTDLPTSTPTHTAMPPTATETPAATETHSSLLPMITIPAQPTLSLGLPDTQEPAEIVSVPIEEDFFEYAGEITDQQQRVEFTFEANENDIVEISMSRSSGDLDPLIQIRDSDDDVVVENDDDERGGTRNAYLQDFVIPATGTYTIIATRFQQALGTSQGNFDLSFERQIGEIVVDNTAQPQGTSGAPTDTMLSYGETAQASITDTIYEVLFEFEGMAGDRVTIRMTHGDGDLDPLLLLKNESGATLIQDDDAAGNRDALINEYVLPRDGTYTIVATRFQQQLGTTKGNFTLDLEQIDRDA
ncbi:pre-peptidase C-terminal domain-containing protein [Phototrophicus methaneseepsis]|uniref:Pre-peptidase C-terminal domain-containing protein n=1 Tax=Phototrophicus methaneseepsis TaxID=2710758 RepID=A0A7S8E5E9_9CHLR|nr:pre-peptidase C-terminal domain-containing protein [Phototrophicus methaneseepsis]QPC80681.1 pre-peptidase C-terminal domain-containing protein [Phototrophicus methaneseepsis]